MDNVLGPKRIDNVLCRDTCRAGLVGIEDYGPLERIVAIDIDTVNTTDGRKPPKYVFLQEFCNLPGRKIAVDLIDYRRLFPAAGHGDSRIGKVGGQVVPDVPYCRSDLEAGRRHVRTLAESDGNAARALGG